MVGRTHRLGRAGGASVEHTVALVVASAVA
eukprot:SAG31_NODE_38301_length_297_cov_0.787879_1_plen_29_part_10